MLLSCPRVDKPEEHAERDFKVQTLTCILKDLTRPGAVDNFVLVKQGQDNADSIGKDCSQRTLQ